MRLRSLIVASFMLAQVPYGYSKDAGCGPVSFVSEKESGGLISVEGSISCSITDLASKDFTELSARYQSYFRKISREFREVSSSSSQEKNFLVMIPYSTKYGNLEITYKLRMADNDVMSYRAESKNISATGLAGNTKKVVEEMSLREDSAGNTLKITKSVSIKKPFLGRSTAIDAARDGIEKDLQVYANDQINILK